MKQPLDPSSLTVESFNIPADMPIPLTDAEEGGGRSRYCTYYYSCQTCMTDCPCA